MRKTSVEFVTKFASCIISLLSCHDRVIFKGYLPFGGDAQLNNFVDKRLKIRRKDFIPQVEQMSQQLVEHAQRTAQEQDAVYQYLQGREAKNREKRIDRIALDREHPDGLLAVLCCQENCRTVKLLHGQGRPWLKFSHRPQRVLYYYFLDPEFGRVHVRIQTWFPFTIQVYVNGHDWLARQMIKHRLGFVQQDNAFAQLDDARKAQQLADRFPGLHWQSILNRWGHLANPLLKSVPWLRGATRAKGRSYAGFNPARREDMELFATVLRGDFELVGFYNRDVRRVLYGEPTSPEQLRKQSHAIGRRLKRLQVRGLVRKIPHTRRWRVTQAGRRLLGTAARLYYHGLSTAA